jgi:hypothetical protein
VVEHNISLDHYVQLHDVSILARKSRCVDCIIKIAIELELHSSNMDREDGFSLSKAWKCLMHIPKGTGRCLLKG